MQNYKGSLIVFGETLLTLASFKFRKSHDIVMKFYLHKNWIIKNKNVCNFDKTFLFCSYEYFCRSTQQKNVWKIQIVFYNKTKTEAILKNRRHSFFHSFADTPKLYKNKISNKTNLI